MASPLDGTDVWYTGLSADVAFHTLEDYLMNKLTLVWIGTDGSENTSYDSQLYFSDINRFALPSFQHSQVLGTNKWTAFKIKELGLSR